MTNLFIEQAQAKQQREMERIQRVQEANKRVIDLSNKGQSYEWGLIEKLKKNVVPVAETVINPDEAEEEFMRTLETYGVGGSKEIYNAWEMALGDRYNDPYYKRMLTIAIELTLKKYVPYPKRLSE